jgi:16S rRNA (uracil1498-N3)-methyltransferase
MADRFHVNQPLGPGPVQLDGPEAYHLAVVCRLRPGAAVCLFNGDGRQYPARVVEVQKRSVSLEVLAIERPDRELGFRLELAVPLPKGDRADFLIEKLTELGATTFVPLQTARSVVHPRDTKLEKLQRHVIEASKQCGRNVLLQVEPLTSWPALCARPTLPARRILAHPAGVALSSVPPGQDAIVAVGPEGGFTDEEVALARQTGWQVVGLGPRILRVETAALVLAAWLGRPEE